MQYPSIIEYDQAIKNFRKNVQSDLFKGGNPITAGIDLIAHTGGYSRIYPIKKNNAYLGLRCWLAEVDGQRKRYTQAYKFFKGISSPYFVKFKYIEKGILVKNNTWPILFMEWVDGIRLNKFIEKYISQPKRLLELSDCFLEMIKHLHLLGVSHGDLQDGNILVSENQKSISLKLIDYDSIFVPTMDDNSNYSVGLAEYQHPKSNSLKIDPKCSDYFSELVIYLSIRAYVEKPELWQKGQSQRLLFSSDDFENPNSSEIFEILFKSSAEIDFLSKTLSGYCKDTDLTKIIPLEYLLSKWRFEQSAKDLDRYFGKKI